MDDIMALLSSSALSVHEGNLELALLLSLKAYLKGAHALCAHDLSMVSFLEAKASVLKVGRCASRFLCDITFLHK